MTPLRDALDVARFGGKTAALARALRAGLPVPDGIALSWQDVDAIAAGQKRAPAAPGLVAVRSSAVDEDSAAASFAGQHTTVLGAEDVARAIVEVWTSGRSASALAYRKKAGITTEPRVAVLIQELIEPTCAGVLFTRDPVSGDEHVVIEASWGLGEAVVQGLVVPERWRVHKSGETLEKDPGEKDVQIVRGRQEPVDDARICAWCLAEHHVRALIALCGKLDAVYGDEHHDVEWALRDDALFLLQRRPITERFGARR